MSENNKKEEVEAPPINTKKWLYSFPITRTYEKEVEETRKENGEEIKVTKKKLIKEEVEVYLKRPTRKMYDECNLFYSVEISKGVKAGLLTRAMISKRYKNDGGGLSEEEQKEFAQGYNELLIKEKEFQVVQLNLQEDEKLSLKERQDMLEKLVEEIETLKADLEKYEVAAESLYEHTAESRAARLTNMWWLFFLTYVKFVNEDRGGIDDYAPFFNGKNFDAKSENYEQIELGIQESEEKRFDNFEAALIEKSSYLLAAWNGGNAKTYEDFKKVDLSLEYIKEEVRKDEALQEVYDDKIKQLAGLEIEIPPVSTEEEPQESTEEEPKEEPKGEPVKPEAEGG